MVKAAKAAKYQAGEREQTFLDSVVNGKYDRQIITGLKKFIDGKAPEDMLSFYSKDELAALIALKDSKKDVEARMPVKMTRHYFELAKKSKPIQVLVIASPKETYDLDGASDPGKQMDYSPVEGLIHKYELGLIYVASTCSAHCRFCYREELIAKKEVERPDGSIAPKGLAQIKELVDYIIEHNRLVADNDGIHFAAPGSPPSPERLEKMTKEYQKQIRNSPLWDEMVQKYGKEKAEKLLKEFKAEVR